MISYQLKNATTHSDYMIHEFKLKKLLNVNQYIYLTIEYLQIFPIQRFRIFT